MINREGRDTPDDAGHVVSLRDDGAGVVRGDAQIVGPGRVRVHLGDGSARDLRGRFVVVAVGTGPTVPDLPGLDDPETAGVGLRLEDAQERGVDAFEKTADVVTSAKGYVSESGGHVSIVVDRSRRALAGAFIAGPGASEAIHLAVLAVKTGTPIDVLADTITAFPTTARVMGGLFVEAARDLGPLRAR